MKLDILPHLCPGCFQHKGKVAVCPQCGFDETKPPAIALPYRTLLNGAQYLTGRVLGKLGGFGITYLALDTQLEDLVAIKEYLPRDFAAREGSSLTVRPHSGEDGEAFQHWLDKFLEEAKAVARFKHPNIVRVRQIFQEHATAYLVMDYLEGQSLNEYLLSHAGPLPMAGSLEIMLPVLKALEEEVHRKQLADLKAQKVKAEAELGIKMVPIPAGEFIMGAAEGEAEAGDDEKPRHTVQVAAFSLGEKEITQGQWQAVMGSNPSQFKQCGKDCPVERVSFDDMQKFLQRLKTR